MVDYDDGRQIMRVGAMKSKDPSSNSTRIRIIKDYLKGKDPMLSVDILRNCKPVQRYFASASILTQFMMGRTSHFIGVQVKNRYLWTAKE